ncbi:hypothetical protein [Streptomyces sp. LN245]|uniref:hypothetical protein n=1 Tax=Streptomyces sp. LN245 TaxID=3112975 RepID=UPI00371E5AF6
MRDLYFLDESGFAPTMPTGHTWSRAGQRAVVPRALIPSRHTVYQLDPAARTPLNNAFIATFLGGGAAGSQPGSVGHHAGGWTALAVPGRITT